MITYKSDLILSATDVVHVLTEAGIYLPGWTEERLDRALKGSSVIITAWDKNKMIGIARSISDFAWCAYLSQLAVLPAYQKQGIGQELIKRTSDELGEEVALLVHSVEAPGFYKKVGFVEYQDCLRLNRKR